MKLTADQVIREQESLKALRGVWETHWQECTDYVVPRKNQFTRKNVPGEKKGVELYDNTAMVSCETLVSSLHGMLTNPNTQWFQLQTGNPEIDDLEHVTEYLQDLSRRMHRVLNGSNFQPEVYEYYVDLASVGTAVMTVEEDKDVVVRFSSKHLGEMFVCENAYGMIEKCFRVFEWEASKIVEEFAQGVEPTEESLKAVVGEKVARAYLKNSSEKFDVVHAVYREDVTTRADMPFVSQYVLKIDKTELKEGRFRRFPYIVSRWSKMSGEVYGRSPAMTALPEAKTLNVMAKTVIKGAQKVVDPPVQMPDDGFVRPLRAFPGGVNYYRAGSSDRIEPIFNDSRIDFGFEAMRERQQRVREAFFVDKLNLVQSDRMTTVEVNQRVQEQLRFLGPLLGRQQTEFLRPLIDRVLDIMVRLDNGTGEIIGFPPQEIQGVELDVQYSSPIARAQRLGEAESLQSAFAASAPLFQMSPDSVDNIDADAWIRENFKIFGASTKVLRDRRSMEAMREARQQAQQAAVEQQQSMAEAEQLNKVAPLVNG
jgi:hypothetical protein